MEHDPLNDKTIINTNKYKIELSKNEINIWITITMLKNNENESIEDSYTIKISDFYSIDTYFNSFKGNINLIYNYLIRIFNKNLYIIEKDKTDTEKLIIKIDCLKENKREYIQLKLESSNIIKIEEENDNNNLEDNDYESMNLLKNCVAAPIVNIDDNNENPNDKETYFYYKNKEKNNEYNIYIYKNEIKEQNYKEIIFKIIDKGNEKNDEYYSYLNLVDFFHMSEFYFRQFNYSIDEIYDDLLIIFSNHNYKMEKSKNCLKIAITFINSIGNQKNFIVKAYINAFIKGPYERNINEILNDYYNQLIRYIRKFGEDINDEKFRNLIKDPDKYIKEKYQKNKEKKKNEIKKLINNLLEEFEKKNNNVKNDIIKKENSIIKNYNKDINIVDTNIIINNKELFDLYIKESKLYKEKNKEKKNINENNDELKNNEKNKVRFNINNNNNMKGDIKIVINKMEIKDLLDKFENGTIKNNDNNNINEEEKIDSKEKENNIKLNELLEKEKEKEENKIEMEIEEENKEKNIHEKNKIEEKKNNIEMQIEGENKEKIIQEDIKNEEKKNKNELEIKEKDKEKINENIVKIEDKNIIKTDINEGDKEKNEKNKNQIIKIEKEKSGLENTEKDKKKNKSKSKKTKNEKSKSEKRNIKKEQKNIDKQKANIETKNEKNIKPENKKENINENINIENKNEKKDKKIEQINNNKNNIPLIQKEENNEKFLNLNDSNPFFLNKKRKRNLSINEKEIMNDDPINIFINAILERRKRLYNNTTLLNDSQLIFLVTKIEKTIPEFRYLNLKIHTDIIFNYDINYSIDNESNIIDEFYEKSKNKKNLIFLIKTKNDKTFGGFSELGFDRNNSIIFDENYSFFVFSIDKMKIYDFVEDNENCVFGYSNKLPEFKNQIFFEDNNLKVGYTGNKKSGFLMNKDYELNDGNKMFYINQIQVISLYVDL